MQENGLSRILRVISSVCLVLAALMGTESALSAGTDKINISYLVENESEKELGLEDALRASDWQNLSQKVANFGFSRKTVWIKVETISSQAGRKVFEIDNPLLGSVDVAILENESKKYIFTYSFGEGKPFRNRPIPTTSLAFYFESETGKENTFLLRIKSVHPLIVPIKIWDEADFFGRTLSKQKVQSAFAGAMVAFVLYNLLVFLSTRNRSYLLYSTFLSFSLAMLLALDGTIQKFVTPDHPQAMPSIFHLTTLGSLIFTHLFMMSFLKTATVSPRIHRFLKGSLYFHLAYTAVGCFGPFELFVALNGLLASTVILAFISIGIALSRRVREARFFGYSWVSVVIGTIVFNAAQSGVIDLNLFTSNSLQIGGFLKSLILAFALADQINQLKKFLSASNSELKFLNDNLESIASMKTREVRALLDYIPQGVLSIEENGIISGQYSRALESILATDKIGGKSIQELILSRTSIDSNMQDQAIQSISASIGESLVTFEMNMDNLPLEVEYTTFSGTKKIFELTWSPDVDNQDRVTRILMTVLDISKQHALKHKLDKQLDGMEKIRELIECGASKFSRFIGAISPLIEEMHNIVSREQIDNEDVKILFVNAHTAKGAARTLGLKKLATSIHEAESFYALILKGAMPIDLEKMRCDFAGMNQDFEDYKRVNSNELGRSEDYSRVVLDKNFLIAHFNLLLEIEESRFSQIAKDVRSRLSTSIDEISSKIFKSLKYVIEENFSQAKRIAKDLGKPEPFITVQADDVKIPQNVEDFLNKACVHILRNAMDHGIETAEERVSAGKRPEGRIEIWARLEEGLLKISIGDDGKGIAISDLRKKGIKERIIDENASLQEITQIVFIGGISTKNALTQISGRGVGMSSLKIFAEEAGGQLQLNIGSCLNNLTEHYSFRIECVFPFASAILQRSKEPLTA